MNNDVNGIEHIENNLKCNHLSVVSQENGENRRSIVQAVYSHYPARIIPIESWKSHVTANILGFGGGIVSGDQVIFDIVVESGASVLFDSSHCR